MNPQTHTSESAAGDGLMVFIAAAITFVVVSEAAFVAYASWLLLPVIMLGVIAAAAAVIFAVLRTIDNDTPIAAAPAEPRASAEAAPAPIRGTAYAGR